MTPDWATDDGRVQLYHCKWEKVFKRLQGIDFVVADPPYGINWGHSGGGRGVGARRNTGKVRGDDKPFNPKPFLVYPCALFGADHFHTRLPAKGTWIAWDKHTGIGPDDDFSDAEMIWTSVLKIKRNVIRFLWKGVACVKAGENNGKRYHPTTKPLGVMRQLMDLLRIPEDAVVCDPFLGSGSTAVACLQTGRRVIGIEEDRGHFEMAVDRCSNEVTRFPLIEQQPLIVQRQLFEVAP